MKNKTITKYFVGVIFILGIACNTVNSSVSEESKNGKFILEYDSTNFRVYDKQVSFGGPMTFTNNTGYLIRDFDGKARLDLEYADGKKQSIELLALVTTPKEKWPNNSIIKFKLGSLSTIPIEEFNRTPAVASLFLYFNGINVDKEFPVEGTIDKLPNWKEIQVQLGLR